jgi:hypothetical protein
MRSYSLDADQCAQEVISAWEAAGPGAAKILPEDCKALFEQARLYEEAKRMVAERLASKMLRVSDNFRLESAEKFFMDAYQVHWELCPRLPTANRATDTKSPRRS